MDRRTKGGLVIPPNVSGVRTLSLKCLICGFMYYDDELRAWQAHVARCARKHEAEIQAVSPKNVLPAFESGEGWDSEYEQWVKDNPATWKRERGIVD